MSCTSGLPNLSNGPVEIYPGSDVTFSVRLIESTTKDPADLTQLTSAVAVFKNADGTFLSLDLDEGIAVASPAAIGKLVFTISAAQSLLLNPGMNSFQITLVINSKTSVVQFPSSLNIGQSVFY